MKNKRQYTKPAMEFLNVESETHFLQMSIEGSVDGSIRCRPYQEFESEESTDFWGK